MPSFEMPVDALWPEKDDAEPVRAAAREREVFELVYRQMRTLAPASSDLDDLVQVAATRAIAGLDAFEGRAEISTWTYSICYRTLLNHQRWYRRFLRRFSPTDELPDRPATCTPVPETLERVERAARLRAALSRLSPKRRAVVVLHDLEDRSAAEIAEVVGAKVATVRSRLRDGHRDLARLLANDPYFGDEACGRGGRS